MSKEKKFAMFLDSKLKKEIIEAKYLSVENTWQYRPIIRIMFKNYLINFSTE